MNEITIFSDREKTKEFTSSISFEPVPAGTKTSKSLFISNAIEFPLDLIIQISGEDVVISRNIKSLNPDETKELLLSFTPKTTRMKPISAELKININYIVK